MSTSSSNVYRKKCMAKLEKMKKEREEFQKEEEEIERRKENYEKLVNAKAESIDQSTDNVLTPYSSVSEVHPGKEVFIKSKRYQNFTFDELISDTADPESSVKTLRGLFQLKLLPLTPLSKLDMKQLFYLMSLDRDFVVSESCYYHLLLNTNSWVPKMKHIVNVFTNWGATYESLRMTDIDISLTYPHNLPKKNSNQQPNELPDFSSFNYEHVLSYLKIAVLRTKKYSDQELLLLLKILIMVSLDKYNTRISDSMKETKLMSVCVESMKEWDNVKVVSVAKYIYDEKDDFHNQIAIPTTILPKVSRSNDIRSCLSFTILSMMISRQKRFQFPYEDDEFREVVQNIETEKIAVEDISELYLIVYLIHSIVRARNMISAEGTALRKIEEHLNKLKMDLIRQHKTYDADLLKGRIALCSALWQLFENKDMGSQ